MEVPAGANGMGRGMPLGRKEESHCQDRHTLLPPAIMPANLGPILLFVATIAIFHGM